MIKRLLLIALLLLVASSAQAANFYVTQSAAGDGTGSSLENAMSAASFNALTGDKGGNTYFFSGTFTTRLSVTAAYGNSTNPMILDGYAAGDCDPLNSVCSGAAVLSQGMEIGNGTHGPDYLIVQDFNMTRTSSTLPGFRIYGYIAGTDAQKHIDHCIIRRNYVHETYGTLFYFYSGRYNIISGNKFVNFGQGGTDATQGVNFIEMDNTVLTGNEMGHDEINFPSGCTSANIIEVHGSNYLLFEYNDIYGAPQQAGLHPKESFGGQSNIIVRFNKIHDNGTLTSGKGFYSVRNPGEENRDIYLYGNNIYGNRNSNVMISDTTNGFYCWSNIIADAGRVGVNISPRYTGSPLNINFFNNTIVRNNTSGEIDAFRGGICVLTGTNQLNFKNNILSNNRPTGSIYYQYYFGVTPLSMEHDSIYHSGGTANYYYSGAQRSLATMQSTYGFENDAPVGAVEDPLFVDPDGADDTYGTEDDDYTLQAESPVKESGATLTGTFSIALSGGDSWFETNSGYSTLYLSYADAIDPVDTDWTTTPPTVVMTKQAASWSRGAYAYETIVSYPNGEINTPATNTTITVGESVSFSGTVTCTASTPCTVLWNFNGGADNSTVEDPGAVTFSTVGVYTVSFTVTDGASVVDPTPDQVTITVRDTGNDFTGDASVKSVWRYENNLTDSVGNNDLTGANSPAYDSTNPIEGSYSIDFEAGSSQRAYIADASLDAGFPLKSDATPTDFTLLQKFKLESLPADNARMMLIAKYDYPNDKRTCYVAVENKSGTGTTLATFAIGYNSGVDNIQVFHDSALSAGVNYGIGFTYHIATDIYRLRMFNLDTGVAVGTDKTGDLSATVAGGFDLNDSPLEIGSFGGGTLYFFDGLNDETVITDRSWTVEEIDAYFTGDFSSATAVIAGISSSVTSGTYGLGATTGTFTVNFNEQVDWYKDPEGTLTLTLVNDTGDDVAVGVVESSGTGYDITFSALTVPAGFNTVDLDAVSIDLTGASYIRVAGTSLPAILTVPQDPDPASLDRHGSIVIDSVAPTWSAADLADSNMSADGTYVTPGQWVYAVFDFSETIYATGAGEWPKMATVGLSPEREWVYIRKGDDADNAVFGLELQAGDRCADLGSATTIDYGTGSIRDAAGNMASTTSLNIAASAAIVLAVPKNADNGSAWWVGSSGDAANIGDLTLVPGDRILIME